MRVLFEAGIGEDSEDISSALAGPCSEASAPHMEVSESIVCLRLHFEYNGSAPLVQQNLPAKSDLENYYSYNLVFSSDTSTYRFTGKLSSGDSEPSVNRSSHFPALIPTFRAGRHWAAMLLVRRLTISKAVGIIVLPVKDNFQGAGHDPEGSEG